MKRQLSKAMRSMLLLLMTVFIPATASCTAANDKTYIFPTTQFFSHYAIIQDNSAVYCLYGSDNTNLRSWVNSVRIEKLLDDNVTDESARESEYNISGNWTYRILFANTDDVITEGSKYYVSSISDIHIVYINEDLQIIQFDNTAYSFANHVHGQADDSVFCDGIRVYTDSSYIKP